MAKNTEKIQNVLTVEHKGKTIVSRPFDYEAFCLVDDMRYSKYAAGDIVGGAHLGKKALNYMFEGTELTDEAIEALDFATRRKLCEDVANMYFASLKTTENETKNQ